MAVTPLCLPSLQDFVSGLSIILRGTIDDRLNWAFNLYDLNKDGCITKEVGADIHRARLCRQICVWGRLPRPHSTGVSLGWQVPTCRNALEHLAALLGT